MLLMAVSVAAITVYVGLYLLTYDANGLRKIPFGDIGESTKIEINVDPDSESIPWDEIPLGINAEEPTPFSIGSIPVVGAVWEEVELIKNQTKVRTIKMVWTGEATYACST